MVRCTDWYLTQTADLAQDKRASLSGGLMRFVLLLLLPTMAPACDRPVCMIDPDSVQHTRNITFDDQVGGMGPGRPQAGVMSLPGAAFGELFAGQILEFEGNYDRVTGAASAPLSVQSGNGPNLSILRLSDTNVLSGFGPAGYPNDAATGEGAIAILFDRDQPSLQFDLRGGEAGSAMVTFMARDGQIIDHWQLRDLSETTYAFEKNMNTANIAGFVITNDDPDGIAFDTLAFEKAGQTS